MHKRGCQRQPVEPDADCVDLSAIAKDGGKAVSGVSLIYLILIESFPFFRECQCVSGRPGHGQRCSGRIQRK